MRRLRSQRAGDVDMVDVVLGEDESGDTVEVTLVHDEAADDFLAVLHEVALEAMALRAHSPGDPRPEVGAVQAKGPAAADGRGTTWLKRGLRRRRVGAQRTGGLTTGGGFGRA